MMKQMVGNTQIVSKYKKWHPTIDRLLDIIYDNLNDPDTANHVNDILSSFATSQSITAGVANKATASEKSLSKSAVKAPAKAKLKAKPKTKSPATKTASTSTISKTYIKEWGKGTKATLVDLLDEHGIQFDTNLTHKEILRWLEKSGQGLTLAEKIEKKKKGKAAGKRPTKAPSKKPSNKTNQNPSRTKEDLIYEWNTPKFTIKNMTDLLKKHGVDYKPAKTKSQLLDVVNEFGDFLANRELGIQGSQPAAEGNSPRRSPRRRK